MMRILFVIFCWVASCNLLAKEASSLELNYLKITKHPLLTDIMFELEPKLIEFYRTHKLSEAMIKGGVRGIALSFRDDQPRKSTIEEIKKISPNSLLRFLKLPQNKYPKLWSIGKFEKSSRKLDSSLRLYKALNGKEYTDKKTQ